MNREKVIRKTILKLADLSKGNVLDFIIGLKTVYTDNLETKKDDNSFPKEVLTYFGSFMNSHVLTEKDKLLILAEAKKAKLVGDVTYMSSLNKNLERAWRTILNKWKMTHYNLSGAI